MKWRTLRISPRIYDSSMLNENFQDAGTVCKSGKVHEGPVTQIFVLHRVLKVFRF